MTVLKVLPECHLPQNSMNRVFRIVSSCGLFVSAHLCGLFTPPVCVARSQCPVIWPVFSSISWGLCSGLYLWTQPELFFSEPPKNVNRYYSFGGTALEFPLCFAALVLPPCAKSGLVPTKQPRKGKAWAINNVIVFRKCAEERADILTCQGNPTKYTGDYAFQPL